MAPNVHDSTIVKLELACSNLRNLLQASAKMEENLEEIDKEFGIMKQTLVSAARRVAPLQSMAMATKALETRINRAVSPALSLLETFKVTESLQHNLLELSSELSAETNPKKRLKNLVKYVDCVADLNDAVNSISQNGEPVIQKLQEVVEFLSRTKATDQFRTERLKETMVALKALYETEVDAMRFEGTLDEALLYLQDEFESILQRIRHKNIGELQSDDGEEGDGGLVNDLGSELEVNILRRISEILANNDCWDLCIEIYVKVRYRRAAKALMRLKPDYLRTYTPEEIDKIEWENLEKSISLWIQHFNLAVKTVFVSEKRLCNQVLGEISIMDGFIWLECFTKIADKIMAVFFRFGEGVARGSKEPQKLFKLLDMFDSLEKLKPKFIEIFEGQAGADIVARFRELEKLLVHASTKVFWEFGLQIEGNSDGFPPPQDGSVPKIVRYAINYLKYLATETYSVPMAKVLRTEQIWKSGILSKPETDENLLKDAIFDIMEALQRNLESKRLRYRDKTLASIFTMNTYWYIYMRSRNTELGKLLGEHYMRKKYKIIAEESAYSYQNQAWGPLVRILAKEDEELNSTEQDKDAIGGIVRGKMESFLKSLEEIMESHRVVYNIPDSILREQMREATVKLVVPVYSEFSEFYSNILGEIKSIVCPETLQSLLVQVFNGGGERVEGKFTRRDNSKDVRSGDEEIAVSMN
ncbi:exocyst complex component EXO70A1-like [Carica papaya]|uniref:exocyst complex component EXO70A1-like n=1 Tax=Carica papaya TaxID=3649 RepID=UPI000B8D00D2|nr:exocyst complex component EXO70A1-like [Carica papaya]